MEGPGGISKEDLIMKHKSLIALLVLVILTLACGATPEPTPSNTPVPSATVAPSATPTVIPTSTPNRTATVAAISTKAGSRRMRECMNRSPYMEGRRAGGQAVASAGLAARALD